MKVLGEGENDLGKENWRLACPKPGKLKFQLFSNPVWNFYASQTSFHGETIGGIIKCLLFSETFAHSNFCIIFSFKES